MCLKFFYSERIKVYSLILLVQAGPSFDLPDPERFRRVNATGWGLDNTPSKLGCVIFDSDGRSNTLKRTGIRRPQDEMSTDSCGENIRYQAVEGLVHQDSRPKRQMSFLKQVRVTDYQSNKFPH